MASSFKPKSNRQKITGEVLNKYTAAQLKHYIETTGKRANRNLIALEKEEADSGSRAYRYVQGLAHDKQYAMHTEKPRFRTTTTGETFQQMKAHAAEIQRFMGARTHTVKGVERAYEKSFNTYIHKRAVRAVEEEKGVGNASKADIMLKEKELKKQISKNEFNQAWGAFNADQYEKAKRMSEVVADLIEQKYSGEDIAKAIDMFGTDRAENEYKNLIDNKFVIKDQLDAEDEEPPFADKGISD